MDIIISTKRFREIITGKIKYRKCLACDNEGREFWEETGCSVLPYPHPDWGDNYESGPCDVCEGVGYVENA
jgi:hypothetical protein